ncbi:riboflavin synthase [bacterium]|nr:riboflavin synthase [bacterium]
MFTGIIEEIGTVKRIVSNNDGIDLTICANKVLENTKIGDSISIEGCCQTVVNLSNQDFTVNVSSETLEVSNFSRLKVNQTVNLERALTLTSRLGGHIVQGHVDGTAVLLETKKNSQYYDMLLKIDNTLDKYIVKKGSIAINGISLTIASIENNILRCTIIPHTFENTTLKNLCSGDIVNIETDILGRYIEKFLSRKDNGVKSRIDEDFLKENGFI